MNLLRRAFDECTSVPYDLLTGCVASLLGIHSDSDGGQSLRHCVSWWRDDNEELARQLHDLLRGVATLLPYSGHSLRPLLLRSVLNRAKDIVQKPPIHDRAVRLLTTPVSTGTPELY